MQTGATQRNQRHKLDRPIDRKLVWRSLALTILLLVLLVIIVSNVVGQENVKMIEQTRELTPEEKLVIIHKGTEPPFSGKYYRHNETGTYHCRNCQAPLFASDHKFDSNCGWPSFDDALPEAVLQRPDTDGHRTEIICAACEGHLGHVFFGEQLTEKDTRHCINSISLNFVPRSEAVAQATAYFAGGCFWGVEYYLGKAEGVLATQVGYMGGSTDSPSYKDVCAGQTGHAEAVEVVFDPSVMSYDELTRLFFEIHDPTQVDRQGPDFGDQYRSAIFYADDQQRQTALKLIQILQTRGVIVATELESANEFWPAESYHQDYYGDNGKTPYCHAYQKRF